MELYLFRHGIAEDAPAGRDDASRALTDDGKKNVAAVVRMVAKAGDTPSLILSSPYVRAMQTARIAADEFGYKGDIVTAKSLVPHGTPSGVWADIRDHRDEATILLASHEPLLSQLVAFLLNSGSMQVEMKKAAMVRIDVASLGVAPRGVLRWMITPKFAG